MRSNLFIVLAGCYLSASAQINDFQKTYDEFRNQAKQEYEDFRRKANEEYAQFVRDAWIASKTLPVVHLPIDDKTVPVIIQEEDKESPVDDKPVVIDVLIDTPEPKPQPKPISPIREQPISTVEYFPFQFYGTEMRVRANASMRFHLDNIEQNSIAEVWERLAKVEYDNLIRDCLENRIRFQLPDWAYLRMLDVFCNSFLGENSNESELLKAFLYCQSGYKMKLATADSHLYMLYASDFFIFERPCWQLEDGLFFADNIESEEIYVCQAEFPNSQALSMQITTEPFLGQSPSANRVITADDAEWLSVSVSEDVNLMNFYQDYPSSYYGDDFMTRWALYANAPLSQSAKQQLYPRFKDIFNSVTADLKSCGVNDSELMPSYVDILCHWIQTGFVYEYDDKVWGHDRAFFADETLFYPFCDCEDRSILLTRLVRDMLGLRCALVYYPGHLATAIAIGENVKGDYIRIDGTKFIVCDPTYIGASIGMTMPDMDNKSAKVIILQ